MIAGRYDPSPAAIRPLMQAHWRNGWRFPPVLPEEEVLAGAVDAGVMFRDAPEREHDEWVAIVRRLAGTVAPTEAGAAFMASLRSRRLDLRSAMSSLAVARSLPEHAFLRGPDGVTCQVCSLSGLPQDRNRLNFERFKWGGVRLDDPLYVALDLELFVRARRAGAVPEPQDADLDAMRALLDVFDGTEPDDSAVSLLPRLASVKGNRAERVTLMTVLAVAGVIQDPGHPGYLAAFTPWEARLWRGRADEDLVYPLTWWRGLHGVNAAAVAEWFPRFSGGAEARQ